MFLMYTFISVENMCRLDMLVAREEEWPQAVSARSIALSTSGAVVMGQ